MKQKFRGNAKLRQAIAKRRKKAQADQFRIKEGHSPSFIDFMLMELQLTDQDLRDPEKKHEIMRLMRAGDQQAQQLVQRAEREKIRDQRTAIQQEKDPRKAALLRRRQMMMKQLQKLDTQLSADTLQQQRQADQNSKL